MPNILEAKAIVKNFGGVRALKGVDFSLGQGDALALVGENGAGKSTLMKIISGVYPEGEFSGEIIVSGEKAAFRNTKDAEAKGIAIIHQELNLFRDLSIGENIFLSHLPRLSGGRVDYETIFSRSEEILTRLGLKLDPRELVGSLNTGNQQMVEIAKALSQNAKALILDEPTSSLTLQETEKLFEVLNNLREKQGLSLIYISHKLDEVFTLCDHVTVLRDGESVFEGALSELSQQDIIKNMVGRELSNLYPEIKKCSEQNRGAPFFEVKNWSAYKISESRYRVKNASLKAYRGEIFGISGVMGAGRTDLILSLFGYSNYRSSGEAFLEGKKLPVSSPSAALKSGLGLVTEDRKKNGLHLEFSIRDNMVMTSLSRYLNKGMIDSKPIESKCEELVEKLKIKIPSLDHAVKTLSGGNQQKVAIGKCLADFPKVIFLDEPTRGIDVGAKFEIYSLLNELVDEGVCVIIASSELPELMGMCDRVLVMREGELVGEFLGDQRSEQAIIEKAVGVK